MNMKRLLAFTALLMVVPLSEGIGQPVTCTPDDAGIRAEIATYFATATPAMLQAGGLDAVNPANLTILTDDGICKRLNREVRDKLSKPLKKEWTLFYFQVDDRFLVYADPILNIPADLPPGVVVWDSSSSAIIAVDLNFNVFPLLMV